MIEMLLEILIEKVQRASLFEKAGDEPLAQTDCSSDLPILRNRFHTSRGSSRISHVCNLSQATLARFVFMFFMFFGKLQKYKYLYVKVSSMELYKNKQRKSW